MHEPGSNTPHRGTTVVRDAPLAFAAFALSHAACGDGVLEVRLGEGCLLEWCSECGVMRTFLFSRDHEAAASSS